MYASNVDRVKIFKLCNQLSKSIIPSNIKDKTPIHSVGLDIAKEMLRIDHKWLGKEQLLFKNNKLIGSVNTELYETSLNSRSWHSIFQNKAFGNMFLDKIIQDFNTIKTIKSYPVYNLDQFKELKNNLQIKKNLIMKPMHGWRSQGIQIGDFDNFLYEKPSIISEFIKGIDLTCFWVGSKVVGWYSRVKPIFFENSKQKLIAEASQLDQERSNNTLTKRFSLKKILLENTNLNSIPNGPKTLNETAGVFHGDYMNEVTKLIPDSLTSEVEKLFCLQGLQFGRIDFIANGLVLDTKGERINKIKNVYFIEFNCTPNNYLISFVFKGKYVNPWVKILRQMIINSKC